MHSQPAQPGVRTSLAELIEMRHHVHEVQIFSTPARRSPLIGLHHSKQFLRLGRVKVSVIALFHTEVVQRVVAGGGKAMASKAALHAYQGAAVKRDDGASGFGGLEQVRHIAADPGNAGHFGVAAAVKLHREVVG